MPVMKQFRIGSATYDTVGEASVTQVQTSGTKIATVTIDGTATDLYAPEGGGGGNSGMTFFVSSVSSSNTPYIDSGLTTTVMEYYEYDLDAAWGDIRDASSIRLVQGYNASNTRICYVTSVVYDRPEDAIELYYFTPRSNTVASASIS